MSIHIWSFIPIVKVEEELLSRHEKVTTGNNSKTINARVKDLVLKLPLIKVYSCIKFNFNSISKTWVIEQWKTVTGKAWQTYRQTDRRTDRQTDRQTDRRGRSDPLESPLLTAGDKKRENKIWFHFKPSLKWDISYLKHQLKSSLRDGLKRKTVKTRCFRHF